MSDINTNTNNPLDFRKELREGKLEDAKNEFKLMELKYMMEAAKENLEFQKEMNKLKLQQLRKDIQEEINKES